MKRLLFVIFVLSSMLLASFADTPTITFESLCEVLYPEDLLIIDDSEDSIFVIAKNGYLCIDYQRYMSDYRIKPVLKISGDTLFVSDSIISKSSKHGNFIHRYKINHLPYGKYVLVYNYLPATVIEFNPNMQPLIVKEKHESIEYIEEQINNHANDTTYVWIITEKMPEFPGGTEALFKYIETKTMTVDSLNSTKRPIVQFIVERNGCLSNIEVVRSCGIEELDKDAISVVENMPKWKPGKVRGIPVRVKYTIPINYRPKK